MSLIRPQENQSSRAPKYDDRKNMSSISVKTEHMDNYNDDQIYKQYKNNMHNTNNNKISTLHPQNKRAEPENQIMEICIPVRIKSEDKDDWIRDLKFTIQTTTSNSNKQTFTLNITDNSDPLYLYLLEISETEFHSIKQEQSLLIEFQQFPSKFYEMLEMSSMMPNPQNSKFDEVNLNFNKSISTNYACILHHTNPTDALLIIQEITQFRQLNHLILRVKVANDSLLKKYLSGLAKDFKSKYENLVKENSELSENYESCSNNLKNCRDELLFINEKNQNTIENLKVDFQRELNELKDKHLEELKRKLEEKELERKNIFNDYENKFDELNRKLEVLSLENKNLEDFKRTLENSEKELLKKKELLENELKYFKSDAESLKSENINFNKTTFSQEKYITELNIKNELLQKQLEEKEKNIQNLNTLVENLTSQKNHIEDSLKILRSTNSKLEDKLNTSINEINKGNEIIQKLQNDFKSQKQKLKAKQQAFTSQEQLTNQKQAQIDELTKTVSELKRNLDLKEEELRNTKKYIDNLKENLSEAAKQSEEQEKVIRFLNQKVNDSYTPYKTLFKKDFEPFEIRKGNNYFNTTGGVNQNNFDDNVGLATNNFGNKTVKENYNNVFNSDNSYKPYFNSNAFQTQGSLNEKEKNFADDNNNDLLIKPVTNFTNYNMSNRSPVNNIPNINSHNNNNSNYGPGKSNSSSVNGDYNQNQNNNMNMNGTMKFQANQFNTNDFNNNNIMGMKGNYNQNLEYQKSNLSNNSNSVLAHKYGNSARSNVSGQYESKMQSSRESNQDKMINANYINTNNEIEEEEPRPMISKEKNSYQGFNKNII